MTEELIDTDSEDEEGTDSEATESATTGSSTVQGASLNDASMNDSINDTDEVVDTPVESNKIPYHWCDKPCVPSGLKRHIFYCPKKSTQ